MAEKLGISKSYYEKVEYGDRGPSYNFICRFRRAFPNANTEYIFLEPEPTGEIIGNNVIIDLENRIIIRNGKTITMTPIDFGLLSSLMTDTSRTVPCSEMLDKVWGTDYDGGSSETVQAAISRLRSKLGTKGLIETITGYGYRWNGK
ncbi:MAG: winged helix-turn-helix domain-containing protein [Peptococcaceae bacterium]|nr:winged helix-turn-helix domain-containing protein [Peptococcaceae bacterium]